ncbi:MAG: nucleoside phosphorylase [Acetobacteraceae bacterium]
MAEPADTPPILIAKDHAAVSVFRPENLMREARRQKRLPASRVPDICVLDPDGDLARHISQNRDATEDLTWPCYHTTLHSFTLGGHRLGVIPYAVGAPFAVLVAEELFTAGCRLLISVTSAGQIVPAGPTPYFVLIDRALRDEGTSYHYLPPAPFSIAPAAVLEPVAAALCGAHPPVHRGATWTTDAPFRETETAIATARAAGVLAVEMEAAALYAFAAARDRDVLCFAHVTNQMAQIEGDFEKGEADGAADALRILELTANAWRTLVSDRREA